MVRKAFKPTMLLSLIVNQALTGSHLKLLMIQFWDYYYRILIILRMGKKEGFFMWP